MLSLVNEHKANASFMFKAVITLIGYWVASTWAVVIYSIFHKIDNHTILLYLLFQTPIIWFSIIVSIGLIHRWMENLTTYDKYKIWCVFIRDLTITILATMLGVLTTIVLYQIEQPLNLSKFIAVLFFFLIVGFTAIFILIGFYKKIIKHLKNIHKN